MLLPTLTTANHLEGIDIDRTELSDNKFIKILMTISFSVYYLAKSLQVFLLVGTAIHLGLALKFYLSILFSVSSFFFFLFFSETSSVCQHSLINISHVFPTRAMMCLAILLLLPF